MGWTGEAVAASLMMDLSDVSHEFAPLSYINIFPSQITNFEHDRSCLIEISRRPRDFRPHSICRFVLATHQTSCRCPATRLAGRKGSSRMMEALNFLQLYVGGLNGLGVAKGFVRYEHFDRKEASSSCCEPRQINLFITISSGFGLMPITSFYPAHSRF